MLSAIYALAGVIIGSLITNAVMFWPEHKELIKKLFKK